MDRLTIAGLEFTKCTVHVAGIEITSKEDWDKVLLKLDELMRDNERLFNELKRIYNHGYVYSVDRERVGDTLRQSTGEKCSICGNCGKPVSYIGECKCHEVRQSQNPSIDWFDQHGTKRCRHCSNEIRSKTTGDIK